MAGRTDGGAPSTVLEHLLWQRDQTYEELVTEFLNIAAGMGERATMSARHLRRLAKGQAGSATPGTRRVLQVMFGQPFAELQRPWGAPPHVSPSLLSNMEYGRRWPGVPVPGPALGSSLVIADGRTNDIARQLLLSQLAVPDHVPPDFTLLAVSEALRREMDDTLVSGTVSAGRLERIEETVAAHIRAYTSTPPMVALACILMDFADVRRLCAERQPAMIQERLSEVAALLATLAADSLMKLGQIKESRAWYGTARLAADDTCNRELRARVRAQEAMLPYYYGDPADTIRLARDAQGILDGAQRAAGALALAAEARALSREPGCRADAERAMTLAQEMVARISEPDNDEAFRFGERRLLFYLSSTLANLGETARASRVQDQALKIYGDAPGLIDPVLIHLDQVQLLSTERDLTGARTLAEQACLRLPAEHRTPIIAARLRQIIHAIPETDETYHVLSGLRQTVMNPNGLGSAS